MNVGRGILLEKKKVHTRTHPLTFVYSRFPFWVYELLSCVWLCRECDKHGHFEAAVKLSAAVEVLFHPYWAAAQMKWKKWD